MHAYDKLGAVAALVLVLFILMIMGNRIFGWVKEFGVSVLEQLGKQTVALENVKQSNASMEINQVRLHERMDTILRCPARPCPLRPSDHLSLQNHNLITPPKHHP